MLKFDSEKHIYYMEIPKRYTNHTLGCVAINIAVCHNTFSTKQRVNCYSRAIEEITVMLMKNKHDIQFV